jgi:hypothetical protein
VSRVEFRELDKVENGRCRLSIPDPGNKDVHNGAVIRRGPAIKLVCKEAVVALCRDMLGQCVVH